MKRSRLAIWLLMLAAPALAATAFPARAQELQGVKVRGEGIVAATPDVATVSITVSALRPTSPAAFNQASDLSDALVRITRDGGVEARDIRTAGISLNPEYQFRDGERFLVGWRATQTFSIRIRDFARVGPLLEQAVQLLGSEGTIQGISYSIEDTNQLVTLARAAAFANARAAAEELARLAGMRLGDVTSIEETSATSPTPVQAGASPTPRPPSPPQSSELLILPSQVQPGQLTVRVTLVIVFSLVRPVGAE